MKKFLKSKFFLVTVLVWLVLLGVFLGRQLYLRHVINREIAGLEDEIAKIEAENNEVGDLINYLKTNEYKERQARSVLNLQKPGEFAVALPEQDGDSQDGGEQVKGEQTSNLKQWWNYFFTP